MPTRCNKPAVAFAKSNGFRVCAEHKENEKLLNPEVKFKRTNEGRCDRPVYSEREIMDHYIKLGRRR